MATHDDDIVNEMRRRLGVVFQDFQLLAQKTAWENIAFALRVIGTPQSRISREVPRALDIVGLAHRAHAQPHELSGGEQQRIAIARAIVNNPTLLLADEPTGNLDPDTASGIAEVLRRINEECGTTVVMATHDRNLVDAMRRRVVRVRDGKVVSDEARGVYHPEDDEPAAPKESAPESTPAESASAPSTPTTRAPVRSTPVAKISRPEVLPPARVPREPIEIQDEARNEQSVDGADANATGGEALNAPPPSFKEKPSTPSAPSEMPRMRLRDPQDAITREALGNHAPLGSDENPIVQYGKH
jgi:cell division transport system ATP-binding protein